MKRQFKLLFTALFITACMIAAAIFIGVNPSNPKASQTVPVVTRQVSAKKLASVLEEKLTADSPAYASQDDLVFLTNALSRNDMETIRSAKETGRIVLLKKNDRFLKTDIGETTDSKKIYLTSGKYYGKSFWIPNFTPSANTN